MAKIIIEICDGIYEKTAVERVLCVIECGKISQKGKSYRTRSYFTSGELIYARCNVNGTKKFVVSKEEASPIEREKK